MFQLWKNWFLHKRNIELKWIENIPTENHSNKAWFCFLFKNRKKQFDVAENNHE